MIGYDAFARCDQLETVNFGQVDTIMARAFSNCTKLKEIDLPQQVVSIEECAFEGIPVEKLYVRNPECEISMSIFTKPAGREMASGKDIYEVQEIKVFDMTVYAYKGSPAVQFAAEYGLNTILLDK